MYPPTTYTLGDLHKLVQAYYRQREFVRAAQAIATHVRWEVAS